MQRLYELGYARIFRPVSDYGVDVMVETSLGRLAVQIKVAKVNKHRTKMPRVYLDLSASAKHQVEHYRRVGVDVFAVRAAHGFYLIPAGDVTTRLFDVSRGAYFEGWARALGDPHPADLGAIDALEEQFSLPWGGA